MTALHISPSSSTSRAVPEEPPRNGVTCQNARLDKLEYVKLHSGIVLFRSLAITANIA